MESTLKMLRKPQFVIIWIGILILVSLAIITEIRGDNGVLATDEEIPILSSICSTLLVCHGAVRGIDGTITTHFYVYRTPFFFTGIGVIIYGILMTVFNKRIISKGSVKFALITIGIMSIGLLSVYFMLSLLIRD